MQNIGTIVILKIVVWALRLAPLWIPMIIALMARKKTPHLTKTQIEYRKKMNTLVRQGKVKNKYGQTETKLFDVPEQNEPGKIIVKILSVIIVFLVLFTIAPTNIKNRVVDIIAKIGSVQISDIIAKTKTENNVQTNVIAQKMPITSNTQSGAAAYLSEVEKATEQNNKVTALINKYYIGEKITEYEINEVYQSLENLTVSINNAPKNGDVLKYNTINIIESNKKILNFIREDINTAGKKMYYNSVDEESKKRSVFLSQQRDLIKGLLGAYEMQYYEDEDGRLHYTYKAQ